MPEKKNTNEDAAEDNQGITRQILRKDKPRIPRPAYIVFCRICRVENLTDDQIVAAHRVLLDVCDKAGSTHKSFTAHSSVYGRFLAFNNGIAALDAAQVILEASAKAGVPLAIGVASRGNEPRLVWFDDLHGQLNLIGVPINVAARLAFTDDARLTIVVESSVADNAKTMGKYTTQFNSPQQTLVKTTPLEFQTLKFNPSLIGKEPKDADVQVESVTIVVYDIVKYSEMDLDEAWMTVDTLRKSVAKVIQSSDEGQRAVREEKIWYSPAGDGGVLVFHQSFADLAWDFVVGLARECREARVKVRLSVDLGSVVFVDDKLPVGTSILKTDDLCNLPNTWGICAGKDFFNGLPKATRERWNPEPHPVNACALLFSSPGGSDQKDDPDDIDAAFQLFPENVRLLKTHLAEHESFRNDLERQLRMLPAISGVGGGVIEILRQQKLDGFLRAVSYLLTITNQYRYPSELRTLLDLIVPLGLRASWLSKRRGELGGKGGTISVPQTVDAFEAAVINAGVMAGLEIDGMQLPGRTKLGPDGKGKHLIEQSSWVEKDGVTPAGGLSQLTQSLITKYGFDVNNPGALKQLSDKLRGMWESGEACYTFSRDLPPGEIAEQYRDFFLVLRLEETTEEVGVTQRTAHFLNGILENLKEFDQPRQA